MFSSATALTRLAKPSHKSWLDVATNGQLDAVESLMGAYSKLLVADRGAGKTAIALRAFCKLQDRGQAKRMLVIAPLRVCQLVWRQEAALWTEFKHLRWSFLHGDKKDARLKDDADVWLINPEGCQWLAKKFWGRTLPFDIVCFDQIIRFKNPRGERAKALRKRLKGVKRRWGLEGAIAPNGYEDLFGQMLMLDDGAALGPYVTHYRDMYFQPDFDGFNYTLQPGAAQRIETRIAPYVFRLPYTELPPLQDDIIFVELAPAERKLYAKMKKDLLVQLGLTTITAANSAVVYGKLKQLANGAVYTGKDKEWAHVHDTKLDALSELIDELGGAPLLIAYEFRHDLARLKAKFPGLKTFDGLNEAEAQELQRAWNANELRYVAAHPASIGHGLNLQKGGACHVAWFSPTVDLNLYEEFIGRLRRRGNAAGAVHNHIIVAKDTVDETLTLPAIREKEVTQATLLRRLAELMEIPAAGSSAATTRSKEEVAMQTNGITKLSRQVNTAAPPQVNAASSLRPAHWNKQPVPQAAPEGATAAPAHNPFVRPGAAAPAAMEQRRAVEAKITQPRAVTHENDATQYAAQAEVEETAPVDTRARAFFSQGVQQTLGQSAPAEEAPVEAAAEAAEKPKRTRSRRADVPAAEAPPFEAFDRNRHLALALAVDYMRVNTNPDLDVLTVANEFHNFLAGPFHVTGTTTITDLARRKV